MNAYISVLASSSSGNALLVVSGETRLLVDAGLSLRRLTAALSECALSPGDLTAILITHEHGDHISGLPALAARFDLPVYASKGTTRALFQKSPALSERLRAFEAGASFQAADVGVETVSTPHDTADSVCYILHLGGFRAAVVTDLGHVPEGLVARLAGVDAIVLESNYDEAMLRYGRYPDFLKRRILGRRGHLSNGEAGETAALLARTGVRHIVLGHLSRDNNTPERALATTGQALAAAGVRVGRDVTLAVAPPAASCRISLSRGERGPGGPIAPALAGERL